MLVEGLGTDRSIGFLVAILEGEGEIPGGFWLIRGPTTLDVSRDRSSDGLEVSERWDDSGAPVGVVPSTFGEVA